MLSNKVVLITGVSKGIGLECMKLCLKKNAFVIGISRTKLNKKLLKIKNLKNLEIIYGDITKEKTLDKILKFQKKNKLFVNCIVNNAGMRFRKKFLNIKIEEFKKVFDNNFYYIVSLTKQFIKIAIKKRKILSIVNISSIVGSRGFSELSAYASSKGALDSFTRSIAIEYPKNVRINNVCPGFTRTSFYKKFKKKKKLYNWTLQNTPLRRWGKSEEISNLVAYLISDKSDFITGQNFYIDGGWTAK